MHPRNDEFNLKRLASIDPGINGKSYLEDDGDSNFSLWELSSFHIYFAYTFTSNFKNSLEYYNEMRNAQEK